MAAHDTERSGTFPHPDGQLVTEEDVRARILVPYLERLGLGPANIRTETKFQVRLGRTVVRVGSDREQSSLAGRLDLLVQNDHGENLFVVEVKSPTEKLADRDRDQAISYARLLEHIAPFAVVTNGSETRLYDTITLQRLDVSEFPQASRYWGSGRDPSSIGLPGLREEAMRTFFGYDQANIRLFSIAQQDVRMRTLRGSIAEGRKYVPSLYIPRPAVREAFERFVASQYSTFALIGTAGVGKTNEICALAEWSSQQHISLFFDAADLFDSLMSTLTGEFNWHFSEQLTPPRVIERLSSLVTRADMQMLIFVDAVDESVIPNFERELSEVAERLASFRNIKLIISANSTQWDRFASFRGSPSRLALLIFPITRQNRESAQFEGRREASGPFELGQFDSHELEDATTRYAAAFNLGSRPGGELREQCRLPFLLRVLGDVYGGRNEPLPHEVAEPDLVRELIEQRLARTSNPDRARLELDSVARALVAKAQEPLKTNASLADLASVLETDVRRVAQVSGNAAIAEELIISGLIIRVRDAEQRVSFRFYFNRIRDYVIARRVLEFDRLSPDNFAEQFPTLLGQPIVRDAASWHAIHGGAVVRAALLKVAQGRALLFLETYERILLYVLPGLRVHFEPFTDGPIALAYGLDSVGLFGWGFFPVHEDGVRLKELHPSPSSDEPYQYQYWRIGVRNVRGGGRDFLVADPEEAAIEFVWRELIELVRLGGLNEDPARTLAEETAMGLAHMKRKELGLPSTSPYADWTEGLLPFDCRDTMFRLQVKFGTDWHQHDWIRKEATHESPWIKKSQGGQVITFPPDIHHAFRALAENDVRSGRYFPRSGSWEYERLHRALNVLLAHEDTIADAPLPRPDRADRESFYLAYSDEQLCTYIEALFLKALDAAQAMVSANFPLFKEKFLVAGLPLGVVVVYWRDREEQGPINCFGQIAYGFVPGVSEKSWVDIHINPKSAVIRFGHWTVETRFGNQKFVRGPRWTGADALFFADGPPFGPESHLGECLHTPIRSLAYRLIKDDFEKVTVDDLRRHSAL
jgi:hypothetical protein